MKIAKELGLCLEEAMIGDFQEINNPSGVFRLSANDQTEVSTTTFMTAAVAACSCSQYRS
ncbi:MAG: hypothetical protein SAK29_30500 [Scytonema sp. PMC 1069.18]|nr:hypothetical protein [Scytonema sp. PMC 1069.18]MEC4879821.1 hypothetical protein [Scytonema sp. PMC 1070.18]